MAGFDNYGVKVAPKAGTSGFTSLAPGTGGGNNTNSNNSGTSNSTTTNNQTVNSKDVTNTSQSSRTQNMTDTSLAALEMLIKQLSEGGTKNMQDDRQARLDQIASAKSQASQYSKGAAYADAKGAMDQNTRKVMDTLMPALARNAEGSGTSQNSMRALLEQQGAIQAAESSSALGLNAASQYGGIANGIQSILAQLTTAQDPAAQALLAALGLAKGAVQNNDTNSSTTRDLTQTTNGTSTTNGTTTNTGQSSTAITQAQEQARQMMGGQVGPSQGTGGGSTFYGKPAGMNSINSFNPNDMMQGFGNFNPQMNLTGLDGLHFGGDNTISQLMGTGAGGY